MSETEGVVRPILVISLAGPRRSDNMVAMEGMQRMNSLGISRMSRWVTIWASLALCVAFSACSNEADSASDGSTGYDPNKADQGALAGMYQFELLSEVITRDEGGFFSAPTEETSTTRLYGVVGVNQTDGSAVLHISFCGIELPEISGYVPRLDEGTLRNLPSVPVPALVQDVGGTMSFQTESSAWVVGASLMDPIQEALPTEGDDSRVLDVDEDDQPGITMMLGSWEIYGAMRLLFQLEGALGSEGRLAGSAQITMDTAVYGDTVPLINVATKLASVREDTTVIHENHTFEMIPVPSNSSSCAQVFEGAPPTEPEEITTTTVGGTCTEDDTCLGGENAACLTAEQGYPDGHCSVGCDGICPPQLGQDVAICVGVDEVGAWCFSGCSDSANSEGCRDGYLCTSVELFGQPGTFAHACMPQSSEGPEPVVTEPAPHEDCLEELAERGVGFELSANPMEVPEGYPDLVCDVEDPVFVDGTLAGVNYRYAHADAEITRIFASCELALAMHDLAQVVQSQGVTDIVHLGAYNCRTISGSSELSQHGYGNAIDVAGVRFDNGTYWTVYDDWEGGVAEPVGAGGDWFLWFVNQLYVQWIFNVILTPEYDDHHDDHIHCDLSAGEHQLY